MTLDIYRNSTGYYIVVAALQETNLHAGSGDTVEEAREAMIQTPMHPRTGGAVGWICGHVEDIGDENDYEYVGQSEVACPEHEPHRAQRP